MWSIAVQSRTFYMQKIEKAVIIYQLPYQCLKAFEDELRMITWLIENHKTLNVNPSPPSALEESNSFLLEYDNYHTHAVDPRPALGVIVPDQKQWVADRIEELNRSREFILYDLEDGDKFLEVMIDLNIAVRTTYM